MLHITIHPYALDPSVTVLHDLADASLKAYGGVVFMSQQFITDKSALKQHLLFKLKLPPRFLCSGLA